MFCFVRSLLKGKIWTIDRLITLLHFQVFDWELEARSQTNCYRRIRDRKRGLFFESGILYMLWTVRIWIQRKKNQSFFWLPLLFKSEFFNLDLDEGNEAFSDGYLRVWLSKEINKEILGSFSLPELRCQKLKR